MIVEAIEKVLELSPPNIEEFEGIKYTDKSLTVIAPSLAEKLKTATLTGFADVVGALTLPPCLLLVQSPTMVTCVATEADKYGRRQEFVTATHIHDQFQFNKFLPPEEFIIGVRSKFLLESDDLEYVLKMASNVGTGVTTVSQDDGISQELSVKRGIAIKGTETLKAMVTLTPWRTFPEAVQPASKFVFRARSVGENQPPHLALIEADGGEWKIEAAKNIATWLAGNQATGTLVTVR